MAIQRIVRSSGALALSLCTLFGFWLVPSGQAWADIPWVNVSASRAEDDRVQIDRVISYHMDEGVPSCLGDVLRWNADDPDGTAPRMVLSGAGLDSEDCTCFLPYWVDDEPLPDATDLPCSWDETSSLGPCPEPFFCGCRFTCKPVFDSPCDGEYRYVAAVGYYAASSLARIRVDWRGACAQAPIDAPSQGCGCFSAGSVPGTGPWPHVIVLLMFLVAAMLPKFWSRRGSGRKGRQQPP